MPDIVDTVESINSIAKKYPQLRQDSKPATFALTYLGTPITLVQNCGFTPELAQQIYDRFHELHSESDEWVDKQIEQATHDGYVTVAFGLRVRTPILSKTVLGNSSTPYEAEAEKRTAANAMGQSYGLLNNRAGIEFQRRVLNSPYVLDIRPTKHIHDAQYFIIKDDPKVIKWVNDNLIECMQWQELEPIKHDQVKLGGDLEIYYPTWSYSTSLDNNLSLDEITNQLSNIKGTTND